MGGKAIHLDVVTEYVRRHPKLPKRTIAQVLMKEQPGLFPTLENARAAVRRVTGACGAQNAKWTKDKSLFRPKGVSGADAWELLMPESWSEPIEPFVLPSSVRRLLVLSDIHVPYHDLAALSAAVRWGMASNPDAVLLNGDTLDFYAKSDHEKDPRKVKWKEELDAGRKVLRMMREAFPNVPIYFKEGNHEYRMERFLMRHAPTLLGMEEFELPVLLRMGEAGIEYIRNKRLVYAGDLTIGHGDEWRGSGGVNPGRWAGLRAKESVLVGHFHRASEHIDRTVRGNIRGYWSTGCLCELQPAYLPYNDWSHGFALVHLDGDGGFEVENKKIIGGKVR